MRINYVLIDYESVQPESLSMLAAENFKVIVFVGASQTKVTFEAAAALQRMGDKAEYVKIRGNWPNALDFHIALYIGQISVKDPTAFFHVVSKDTGFDPLIQHLKGRKIFAARSVDVNEIPLVKVANTRTPAEKLAVVVNNLQQRGASMPRTLKTLTSTVRAMFQKQLSENELEALMGELLARDFVTVTGTKVSYDLPDS